MLIPLCAVMDTVYMIDRLDGQVVYYGCLTNLSLHVAYYRSADLLVIYELVS